MAMVTDIKKFEISHKISIIGGLLILLFIGLGFVDRTILWVNFLPTKLTLSTSIISGLIVFVIFLILPIGGGDMKFLTFISLYFGVVDTLVIYILANCIALIYGVFSYIMKKNKPEGSFKDKVKYFFHIPVPLMVGICPATIFLLLINII